MRAEIVDLVPQSQSRDARYSLETLSVEKHLNVAIRATSISRKLARQIEDDHYHIDLLAY